MMLAAIFDDGKGNIGEPFVPEYQRVNFSDFSDVYFPVAKSYWGNLVGVYITETETSDIVEEKILYRPNWEKREVYEHDQLRLSFNLI